VTGAGPAGEVAARRLNGRGPRTALVEPELIGGASAPGHIPSHVPIVEPSE
jgi:pyruvate/2-oxoglutarate dehydrogenase complex dihydrolipoamide dehydrogenase (E3) component